MSEDEAATGFEAFEQMLQARFYGPCTEPLPDEQAARLRAHVLEIAAEHNVHVHEEEVAWLDAAGDLVTREIVTPPITSELAYFVALHELGHYVLDLDSGDTITYRRYDNEAAVDEWAIGRALIAPSTDTEEKLIRFLISDEPGPGREEAPARVRAACAARRGADDVGARRDADASPPASA